MSVIRQGLREVRSVPAADYSSCHGIRSPLSPVSSLNSNDCIGVLLTRPRV